MRLLDWEEAHVGFGRAVADLPAGLRGAVPAGFQYSAWQLVEHLRLSQQDLLDFCVNPGYVHTLAWPDDYWPRDPAPAEGAWAASLAEIVRDREALQAVVRDPGVDLFGLVPAGTAEQTVLRAVLLVADHAAYHVGQLIALRRALGCWP